jgi:hypothetical protein
MAVHSERERERLLRQKSILMKQKTLQEVFNNVICNCAASSLENHVPGPSSDVQIQPYDDNDCSTDVPCLL